MMMKNFAFALITTYCVAIKVTEIDISTSPAEHTSPADDTMPTDDTKLADGTDGDESDLLEEEERLHDMFKGIVEDADSGDTNTANMRDYADALMAFAKNVNE